MSSYTGTQIGSGKSWKRVLNQEIRRPARVGVPRPAVYSCKEALQLQATSYKLQASLGRNLNQTAHWRHGNILTCIILALLTRTECSLRSCCFLFFAFFFHLNLGSHFEQVNDYSALMGKEGGGGKLCRGDGNKITFFFFQANNCIRKENQLLVDSPVSYYWGQKNSCRVSCTLVWVTVILRWLVSFKNFKQSSAWDELCCSSCLNGFQTRTCHALLVDLYWLPSEERRVEYKIATIYCNSITCTFPLRCPTSLNCTSHHALPDPQLKKIASSVFFRTDASSKDRFVSFFIFLFNCSIGPEQSPFFRATCSNFVRLHVTPSSLISFCLLLL